MHGVFVCVNFSTVLFSMFYVTQKQGYLSLFLLTALPPGLSILSLLYLFSSFLVQKAIPGRPYHILPPSPLLLFSLVMLS